MEVFEREIRGLLERAGIEIDGDNPWDIQVHDPAFYRRTAKEGSLGFGDSYVEGQWDCADLPGMFRRLTATRKVGRPSLAKALMKARYRFVNLQTRLTSRRVVDHHYEHLHGLYENMLDPHMQYSCGYWPAGTPNLTEAQFNKMQLIADKLRLEGGETLLDIGCGWGGLLRYITDHYDCRATGINLAASHIEHAQHNLLRGAGVDLQLRDYRDMSGVYDRIICIGVSEHFGRKNYRTFFEVVAEHLDRDGIFLLHTIADNRDRPMGDRWILENIFPNSHLPSAKLIVDSADGLFKLQDLHNLNVSYSHTLDAWHDNFVDRWNAITARHPELDNERFFRKWTYYLKFSSGSFASGGLQLYQMVFTKLGSTRIYPTPTYERAPVRTVGRSHAAATGSAGARTPLRREGRGRTRSGRRRRPGR